MKKNQTFLFYASGIFSFGVYGGLLFILFFTFQINNIIKYTSLSETNLAIQSIEIEAIIEDLEQIKGEDNIEEKEVAYAPLEGVGVKDAFASIDSKKILKEDVVEENRAREAINKKSSPNAEPNDMLAKTRDLQKRLTALNETPTGVTTVAKSDGEYDEWYAKIDQILQENWRDSLFYQYATAKVVIVITNTGKFSYRILKASGILAFDNSLKNMLENLKDHPFPPYEKGPQTSIEVTFTKGEK